MFREHIFRAARVRCPSSDFRGLDRRCIRLLTSGINQDGSKGNEKKIPSEPRFSAIPSPTWSIASLELDKQHEPISEKELSVLAKRALIELPSDESSSKKLDTDQLRQDLGNMLHMIRQVQDFTADNVELTDEDIYDRPRGVHSTPVRRHGSTVEEDREAELVWKSLLEPKTSRVGARHYFVVATKEEKLEDKTRE